MQLPREAEEGIGFPGAGVTGNCKSPTKGAENQTQAMPLSTEPSPQPHVMFYMHLFLLIVTPTSGYNNGYQCPILERGPLVRQCQDANLDLAQTPGTCPLPSMTLLICCLLVVATKLRSLMLLSYLHCQCCFQIFLLRISSLSQHVLEMMT